ncbi:MAG: SPOR domain-containing protein [Polynucleobacter sp.]|nr:SPOR domain-containing protein [Polynucleobacter sp.]
MIRLSRLFKRESSSEEDRAMETRARSSIKTSGRSSRANLEDPVLTEDPERQRARHRLIGAAVLVLIAVIVLPRILDNKPKPVSNDIAVNIVGSLPVTSTVPTPAAPPESKPADAPKAAATPKESPEAVAPAQTTSSAKSSQPKSLSPNGNSGTDKTLGLAAGEEIVAANGSGASSSASVASGTGKLVIQIGAFASEDRAKGWIAKLKEQKIPNYVLNRTAADGTKLYALRAGPFADRDSAETAEKKIKAMGLTPRIVEVGKQ